MSPTKFLLKESRGENSFCLTFSRRGITLISMLEELKKILDYTESEIRKTKTEKHYISPIRDKIDNLPIYILQGSLKTVIKYLS